MAIKQDVDFSKLVLYGYLIHHQDPRILKYYAQTRRRSDGLPYPAWLAMGNATASESPEPVVEPPQTQHEGLGQLYGLPVPLALRKKRKCLLLKIIYVALCIINILLSIAVIAVTISTAITMRIFAVDQSGRLVAMILLSVLAAVTLSITIYAMVGILRRHLRILHVASVVLVILAVIQALILAVSVRVTERDELNLSIALSESFKLAIADNPRHVRLWSIMQNDLQCCAVYGPQDYRNPKLPPYFAPDVPISCCPNYMADRSELVQERERQACKAKRLYSEYGCRNPVINMYTGYSKTVVAVTSFHIGIMVIIAILGCLVSKRLKTKGKTGAVLEAAPPQAAETSKQPAKTKTSAKV
ncbi:hypothetical protein KGM_212450 [Danaus plexippus plexippus]|uniref:Uncharacterized protein n=1 Tax=Danaus plexippus plexippus TaxID=278856 RepID=A0A212F1Q0_DANPL|nr:hypothetical protein KGM_212450 [Danaus plexippus plexippus]